MNKEKTELDKTADLRKKAEQKLNSTKAKPTELQIENEAEVKKLLHELEVHQIELEMQNDELSVAKKQIEEISQKYIELFSLSSGGLIVLGEKGEILNHNLAARLLLDEIKDTLNKANLYGYIDWSDRDILYLHLAKIWKEKSRQSCELKALKKDNTELYLHLQSIALQDDNNNSTTCLTAISDITDHIFLRKID